MKTNHTPGPWSVRGTTQVVGGNPELHVADCSLDRAYRDEDAANARLIAAAPDLLAALDDLLGKLEVMSGCNEHDMSGPEELPEFSAARAAIAKAMGGA